MAAVVSWPRHSLHKLFVFYLFYILLRGLVINETLLDTKVSSSSLFMEKLLLQARITAPIMSTRRAKSKPTISLSLKLAKTCQIQQHCLLATLVLLSGDIQPNPRWSHAALNKSGLKIAHLNVLSLSKHRDEFQILMQENPFDVMCLTETWLKPNMSDAEFHLDGYSLIRNGRTDKGAGGTAIYYNSKLKARQRTDINSGLDIESIWLEITFLNPQ